MSGESGLCHLVALYSAFPLLVSASFDDDVQGIKTSSCGSPTCGSSPFEPVLLNVAFANIFDDFESSWESAQDTSRRSRELEGMTQSTSLGYGEILPETVFKVMEELKNLYGLEGGGVVYDLGSGSGRGE